MRNNERNSLVHQRVEAIVINLGFWLLSNYIYYLDYLSFKNLLWL